MRYDTTVTFLEPQKRPLQEVAEKVVETTTAKLSQQKENADDVDLEDFVYEPEGEVHEILEDDQVCEVLRM